MTPFCDAPRPPTGLPNFARLHDSFPSGTSLRSLTAVTIYARNFQNRLPSTKICIHSDGKSRNERANTNWRMRKAALQGHDIAQVW